LAFISGDQPDRAALGHIHSDLRCLLSRNPSDREAPWEKFHATVDGLLERIELPR
jgi:hypothetical protein